MNPIVLCSCLAVLIPVVDQLSKYLVNTFMTVDQSIPVLGEFFRLTYILNDGMAFGSMGGSLRWVFMVITPLALIAVAVYVVLNIKKLHILESAALTMIFAGGFSNMIDRIFFTHLDPTSTGLFDGRVIDFLDFNVTVFGVRIWKWIFNVADAFVVVGVFLFAIVYIVLDVKKEKKKKTAAAEAESESRS